ncbi:CPNE9 protein, partial [Atractosteus spatula]|nr:CPNE9 protein [Atractosteus spatula]
MASIGDFDPLHSSVPATKIEITVSCRNLLDMDTFSKSDPVVVLYVQGIGTKEWREFGRTEVIDNTLNPDFVRKFVLDFFFEEKQNLRFDVLICPFHCLLKDFLGQTFCTLGEIIGSTGSRLEKTLSMHLFKVKCNSFTKGFCWEETSTRYSRLMEQSHCVNVGKCVIIASRLKWHHSGEPSYTARQITGISTFFCGVSVICQRKMFCCYIGEHLIYSKTLNKCIDLLQVWNTTTMCGIPGKKCGTIILSAEELSNCRDIATMQLCANKLDKKDFFGKSDPFLVFYRSNEDGTFTICHKTEVIKNTLNPVWQPFTIPVRALCNGDYDRTVKVDVYDWDRDGSHDFIGEFTTSYRELSRGQSQFNVYEVLNPKKKGKKKKYINSGTVTLLSFKVESEYTFVDFIRGGTQLNFTVAIDFTASNGNPSQPTSLHYMNPYQMNAYAMALKAVGEIIQDYDSDKLFPAYGFGAKLPPDGKISHVFPLNADNENPNCVGIEGVLEAYFQSLRTVQLYGPTNFAPVINQVARQVVTPLNANYEICGSAADITDGSQYFVLLIITDGVISDMVQTKEAIVNASSLPMSIIIVGVGPAEFDEFCSHTVPVRLCRTHCHLQYNDSWFLHTYKSLTHKRAIIVQTGIEVPSHAEPYRDNLVLHPDVSGVYKFRSLVLFSMWALSCTERGIIECWNCSMNVQWSCESLSSLCYQVLLERFSMKIHSKLCSSVSMEELDGDEVRVSSRGQFAERDIVQFVPFRDYIDRSGNQVLSMARLAKDVLAEIPEQLLSFMKSHGIEPRPALGGTTQQSLHMRI